MRTYKKLLRKDAMKQIDKILNKGKGKEEKR